MKKVYLALVAAVVAGFFAPVICAAAPPVYSGTVTKIYGSGVYFISTNAATYSADSSGAQLLRKNGAMMALTEILVGDKVQVTGQIWHDNSISAAVIKDMSLYAHTGTFSGKITGINTSNNSFTLQTKAYGDQTINTTNLTAYTKNDSSAGLPDMQLGMTASVKGQWERSNKNVTASSVAGIYKPVSIDLTGSLLYRIGTSLTVLGNGNVLYGVDAGSAKLVSKNNKTMSVAEFKQGDTLRVTGKHLSGMVAVTATQVKDNSVVK
ncbi:MAG: DUF5666 domain-containing protein [Candidatus Doudnabacteria bacterium]|nr:DUF5666 domain-containing protein [Candidatus Doudnabacteria bacterium]